MTEFNNSQNRASSDLVDKIRDQAKHIADIGQNVLKHLAKGSVSRVDGADTSTANHVIDGEADVKHLVASDTRYNPHQLFRQQLPSLTQQLLCKRFNSINRIASFVAPQGSFDKAADQILEILADFASSIGDSYQVLDEAGVGSLAELQHDTARSGRLAKALGEQNRLVGIAQGALSGAFGIVGAAADLPLSMIIALRTIYLTGRAYGFDLDQPEDRALVFEALSKVDLTLVAEKQAIFIGLRTLSSMMNTGDWQHLQNLIGSNNNIEPLRKFLSDESGQLKWKLSPAIVSKISPLVGGAAGAIYNARFIKEVSEQAQVVFSQARQQLLEQKPNDVDAKTDAKLAKKPNSKDAEVAAVAAQAELKQSDVIQNVALKSRAETEAPVVEAVQDAQIHQQLAALADKMVENGSAADSAAKPKATRRPKKAAPATPASNESAANSVQNAEPVKAAPRRRSTASKATPTASKAATPANKEEVAKPAPRKRAPAKKATPPKDDSTAE